MQGRSHKCVIDYKKLVVTDIEDLLLCTLGYPEVSSAEPNIYRLDFSESVTRESVVSDQKPELFCDLLISNCSAIN